MLIQKSTDSKKCIHAENMHRFRKTYIDGEKYIDAEKHIDTGNTLMQKSADSGKWT